MSITCHDRKSHHAALALALGALLTGCQPEKKTAAAPDPIVNADSLVMDTNSAQLAAFVTAPVETAPGSLTHLNGRLVWDDDVTVRVFSPFAGRVREILANGPQFCLPLFVITDPTRLWVLVDATEQDLPDLKPGQEIVIHARAYPNREFQGGIDVVADALDAATYKVRARASVRNPERLLKGEMFVTVDLPVTRPAGIQVPVKAVFLKGEKQFVFVEEGRGQFRRREIKADPAREGKVRVLEGVRPGERVVMENALLLEQMMNETSQGI